MCTVNQQILAAVKLGVSQNKVIWHLLNLASPRLCCVHRRHLRMLAGTNIRKIRNWPNSPNIIARQNFLIYSMHNLFCVYICIYFCFCGGGWGGGGGGSFPSPYK